VPDGGRGGWHARDAAEFVWPGHGGINPPIFRAVCVARKIASFYSCMKKLVAPGLTLIVSQYSFSRGRRFDPWCTHGHFDFDWQFNPNSTGAWAVNCSFELSDGHGWGYFYGNFADRDSAVNFFNQAATFPSANGRVGFIGEWFNSVCRGQPTEKYLIL